MPLFAETHRGPREKIRHTSRRLTEAEWPLPPILVHRATMQVIDGFHRVSAGIEMNLDEIDAYFFDGSLESAFVVAVEANATHGLPLSLADRRAAAGRILLTHPHWSDRAIARTTGLSPRKVAAIRCASAEHEQLHIRLGKDGRLRPLSTAAGRQLAAKLISSQPDLSLREVAEIAGISPGTVRDVRARLDRGDDPALTHEGKKSDTPRLSSIVARRETADVNPILLTLSKNPALRMSETGRELLRWLHLHAVNSVDSTKIADSIPDHCVEHLVELASRCSANWERIASDLARRLQMDSHLNLASAAGGQ